MNANIKKLSYISLVCMLIGFVIPLGGLISFIMNFVILAATDKETGQTSLYKKYTSMFWTGVLVIILAVFLGWRGMIAINGDDVSQLFAVIYFIGVFCSACWYSIVVVKFANELNKCNYNSTMLLAATFIKVGAYLVPVFGLGLVIIGIGQIMMLISFVQEPKSN